MSKSKSTSKNLHIGLRLKNRDTQRKFNQIKHALGVAHNTDVIRFLITEYYKKIARENLNKTALLYPEEAQALFNSLKRIKKLVSNHQADEKWLIKVNEELNRWIDRIHMVLRVRT